MLTIFIIIYIWVGGLDWFFDSIECLFNNSNILPNNYSIWEPNLNSYNEWKQSMLEKDPNYDNDFLSKQEYINTKYPNLYEIEDNNVLNYILVELYENDEL